MNLFVKILKKYILEYVTPSEFAITVMFNTSHLSMHKNTVHGYNKQM